MTTGSNPTVSVSFRCNAAAIEAVDDLAAKAGLSRAAMLDKVLVAGLQRVDIQAITEERRAASRLTVELRTHVLAAISAALKEFEARKT